MAGVIYILTNPSFPQYVKIGYTDDIDRRLAQLNRSECIPFAFRVYATYQVDARLSDVQVHAIINTLNPDLRSEDNVNGRIRVREFYAMAPEDAYSILWSIAAMHDLTHRLTLYRPTAEEAIAEETAQAIEAQRMERAANFSFGKCQIPVGEMIQYAYDPSLEAQVVSDRNVAYQGETMSLTALAKLLSGIPYSIPGPKYFKYKGEWLNDIRRRLGV